MYLFGSSRTVPKDLTNDGQKKKKKKVISSPKFEIRAFIMYSRYIALQLPLPRYWKLCVVLMIYHIDDKFDHRVLDTVDRCIT